MTLDQVLYIIRAARSFDETSEKDLVNYNLPKEITDSIVDFKGPVKAREKETSAV
jgi:hypothetical protein